MSESGLRMCSNSLRTLFYFSRYFRQQILLKYQQGYLVPVS